MKMGLGTTPFHEMKREESRQRQTAAKHSFQRLVSLFKEKCIGEPLTISLLKKCQEEVIMFMPEQDIDSITN